MIGRSPLDTYDLEIYIGDIVINVPGRQPRIRTAPGRKPLWIDQVTPDYDTVFQLVYEQMLDDGRSIYTTYMQLGTGTIVLFDKNHLAPPTESYTFITGVPIKREEVV